MKMSINKSRIDCTTSQVNPFSVLVDEAIRLIASSLCEDCIAILDYLADQAARGADPESLRQAVQKHLARCPDCHEQYHEWLRELEST